MLKTLLNQDMLKLFNIIIGRGGGRGQTRMPTPIQIAPVRQRQQPVRQPVRQQPVQQRQPVQQQTSGGLNAAPYGPSFEMCLSVLLQKHRLNGK